MPTLVPRRPRVRSLVALFAMLALTSAARAQGTAEQQEACTPDAVKLCASAIPDIPKVTACMKAHLAQLTPRCRAAFNDATAPKPHVATREERRAPPTPRAPRREAVAPRAKVPEPRSKVAVARPELPAPRRPETRDDDDAPVVVLPETPAPPPDTQLPGMRSYKAEIAKDCREGLIDPFTCRNTFQALHAVE